MSYYEIRPINRSCGSYGPGHQTHWIQAKKSTEEQPVIDVSIVVHLNGRVDLEGDDLKVTMWDSDGAATGAQSVWASAAELAARWSSSWSISTVLGVQPQFARYAPRALVAEVRRR